MGSWNTGIMDCDTSQDVKLEYEHFLGEGKSPDEAIYYLTVEQAETLGYDEYNLKEVWLAIAYVQLELKHLSDKVKQQGIAAVDYFLQPELYEEWTNLAKSRRIQLLKFRDRLTGETNWSHLVDNDYDKITFKGPFGENL